MPRGTSFAMVEIYQILEPATKSHVSHRNHFWRTYFRARKSDDVVRSAYDDCPFGGNYETLCGCGYSVMSCSSCQRRRKTAGQGGTCHWNVRGESSARPCGD